MVFRPTLHQEPAEKYMPSKMALVSITDYIYNVKKKLSHVPLHRHCRVFKKITKINNRILKVRKKVETFP